jgi:hypothetical protein
MTAANVDPGTGPDADGALADGVEERPPGLDPKAVASVTLSVAGFLTLLKLADRRDRTPARALGLFVATSAESIGGTVLGLSAAGRAREADGANANLLLASCGAVLGVITTLLNLNWMRTRRRL